MVTGCRTAPAVLSAGGSSTTPGSPDLLLGFSNWPGYIDESEDGSPSTLEQFRAETGIDVVYTADINDGNEFLAKVQAQGAAKEVTAHR